MFYRKNIGSAAVEATLLMPVFILAIVSVYITLQCRIAEGVIYEAAMETIEYMAELTYLSPCDVYIAELRFPSYVDDSDMVNRYVRGGVKGVTFTGSTMLNEKQEIELKVSYELQNHFLPVGGTAKRSFTLVKRAYVGDGPCKDEVFDVDDCYVFVTDNQEVYHSTRTCTYLCLSIEATSCGVAKEAGFTPCEYCGGEAGNMVFITEQGNRYHSRTNCTGLKRTVYRKKKTEVQNLRPCGRCS